MAKNRFNIAVIAGDGIGKEVVPEGLRVLEAVAARFGINLHYDHFDFSSYDYYAKHGDMLPEDWKDQMGVMTRSSLAPSGFRTRFPTIFRCGGRF